MSLRTAATQKVCARQRFRVKGEGSERMSLRTAVWNTDDTLLEVSAVEQKMDLFVLFRCAVE